MALLFSLTACSDGSFASDGALNSSDNSDSWDTPDRWIEDGIDFQDPSDPDERRRDPGGDAGGDRVGGGSSDSGAPVPEPGTMLLLGTGLVGLAMFRRRERSNADASDVA